MEETDVLIIGGGPAGAVAALTLAQSGRNCVVIEAQTAPVWKIGETLAPESRQILQGLGLWAEFEKGGHLPSPGNCSAWGGNDLAAKDFIFNPHGGAWQLDRPEFERMLLSAAVKAGAKMRPGHGFQTLEHRAEGWAVAAGQNKFHAQWLIDASGRASAVARHLGIVREIVDKLVAIFAIGSSPSLPDADARTYIEACADGWWYSALVPGQRRIFAFLTDADLLPGQQWREPRWFRERLSATRHIRTLFESPGHHLEQSPRLTSAHSSRLDQCCGDGWLAVGDAAQSFDPLSGEGLFHALLTGCHAARHLISNSSSRESSALKYATLCRSLWNRFLINRQNYYAMETRWEAEPFWQRRHSPV